MGGILSKLFESDVVTFLIVFLAVPYLYLSLATEVQKDCIDVVRQIAPDKRRLRLVSRQLEDITYMFDIDWWLIAAVAILLLCLFYCGALLANSAIFCTELRPSSFGLPCNGGVDGGKDIDYMKLVFMMYTLFVGILLSFRIWWARIAVARQIRQVYADFGTEGNNYTARPTKVMRETQ